MPDLTLMSKDDLREVVREVLENVLKSAAPKSAATPHNPLLTRTEAAAILNVSLVTLNAWEREKLIPMPKRVGKRVYFLRQELLDYVEQNKGIRRK